MKPRTSHLSLLTALVLALCAPFAAQAQITGTTGRPGLFTGKTVWVDGTNGSNTTGLRGRADRPFLTIASAISAASSGDTVQVRSGNYAEFLTLKNGVNLTFEAGAKLLYTGTQTGTALIDNGVAVTCNITGLWVESTSSDDVHGIALSAASTVNVQGWQIDTSGDGYAMQVSAAATVRADFHRIVTDASNGVAVETAGAVVHLRAASATCPLLVSAGTLYASIASMAAPSGSTPVQVAGGVLTLRNDTFDDANSASQTLFALSGGTTNLILGSVARATAGHGISISSGTCNFIQGNLTGSWATTDKALVQTGGTLNVFPGARYDGTETSGTITYVPVYGTTPAAYGLTLLNAASASAAKTLLALPVEIGVAMSDETTAITTGTAKVTFRAPFAFTVTGVRASLTTVSSSGTPTVDINESGTTILSTKLTIDANEKTSTTAATAAVISDTAIADDAEITLDIDVAGTGAAGLKVWILGTR